MRRLVFAAFAFTVLAACQTETTVLTEEQKAEIVNEVNALHTEAWNAWRLGDVDRGMSHFPDSPELTYVTEGQLFRGTAAVDDESRAMFVNVASQTVAITESYTDVLAPNVVCINETATYNVADTAGVVGPEGVFAGTYIWVRRDGEWKMQSSHESVVGTENQ